MVNSIIISRRFIFQIRLLSSQKKGFLGGFFENLKEEYSKNKEMKDSIKKFRAEAQKLEESDALKEARKKYVIILIQILIKNNKIKNFLNQQKRKN